MSLAWALAQNSAGGVGAPLTVLLGIWCFLLVLAAITSLFCLWMLVDAVVNEPDTNSKLLWGLIIFLGHLVGAVVYYVVRYRQQTRTPMF